MARHKTFFALLALAAALGAGCGRQKPPPAPPPPAVTVAEVVQREVMEWDEYTGRLEPVESVEVRARVNGYLESIHFEDGALVKKGDLLFVIDPRPYKTEFDRAEAELARSQTRLELASNDFERAARLFKSRAISEEEFDARSKAKKEADSALAASKAALEAARLNLEYTRILAPIDGRISRRYVTVGNLVSGGLGMPTLLTTIVSTDPVYCYVDADERSVLKYQQLSREGKRVSARDFKIPCELGLANETGFPHKGVIDFVDNRLDPNTGTLRGRGVFTNGNRSLTPGLFARMRIPGSGKYQALLLPERAFGNDQSVKFVYVVNAESKVEFRPVVLGPVIDGLRVVREGLKPGERVIIEGHMRVRPGLVVDAKSNGSAT
jgi:membrane fusion protein, multidrug efflux system